MFRKSGWDTLYIQAMQTTEFTHISYFNKQKLQIKQSPRKIFDPPIVDKSGLLEAYSDVFGADGAFFTFTPNFIKEIGYCDEANLLFSDNCYSDLALRAARMGLNNEKYFYDLKNSNDFITFQIFQKEEIENARMPMGLSDLNGKEIVENQESKILMMQPNRIHIQRSKRRFENNQNHIESFHHALENVYVINLESEISRFQLFTKRASSAGISWSRIPAVDKNSPTLRILYDNYVKNNISKPFPQEDKDPTTAKDFYYNYRSQIERAYFVEITRKRKALTPGGFGYLFSWMKILLESIKENRDSLVIMDDDVVFHKDFQLILKNITQQLPQDWMLVYLGALQYRWSDFRNATTRPWITWYSQNLYMPAGSCYGSHAMVVRKTAFLWLMRYLTQVQYHFWRLL